jgi:hypothetical protein
VKAGPPAEHAAACANCTCICAGAGDDKKEQQVTGVTTVVVGPPGSLLVSSRMSFTLVWAAGSGMAPPQAAVATGDELATFAPTVEPSGFSVPVEAFSAVAAWGEVTPLVLTAQMLGVVRMPSDDGSATHAVSLGEDETPYISAVIATTTPPVPNVAAGVLSEPQWGQALVPETTLGLSSAGQPLTSLGASGTTSLGTFEQGLGPSLKGAGVVALGARLGVGSAGLDSGLRGAAIGGAG